MTNTDWLKELFSQSHLSVSLCDSYVVKWFDIKKGRALYNPKQADKAHPVEFKLHVLSVMYAKLNEFKGN